MQAHVRSWSCGNTISAFTSMHKNIAVHKLMDQSNAYSTCGKKPDSISTCLKRNIMQMIMEHTRVCERKACFICEEPLLLNCLMDFVVKVLLKCVICISISLRFQIFPNFCTQISRPLTCCVCISSKASATAARIRSTLFSPGWVSWTDHWWGTLPLAHSSLPVSLSLSSGTGFSSAKC